MPGIRSGHSPAVEFVLIDMTQLLPSLNMCTAQMEPFQESAPLGNGYLVMGVSLAGELAGKASDSLSAKYTPKFVIKAR